MRITDIYFGNFRKKNEFNNKNKVKSFKLNLFFGFSVNIKLSNKMSAGWILIYNGGHKMKKMFKLLLVVSLFACFVLPIDASNGTWYAITEADKASLGDEYDDIIVVYDEATNYFNPDYFTPSEISLYAMLPGDNGEGGPFFYKYFSRVAWVTRNGIVSLALTPKVVNVLEKNKNWDSIYASFSDDSQWVNSGNPDVDEVMEKQFACHFDGQVYIEAGDGWNLEPHRDNYSYTHYLANRCNPD